MHDGIGHMTKPPGMYTPTGTHPPGRYTPLGRYTPHQWSMSGQYASYWNAFLVFITVHKVVVARLCFYMCLSFCPQGMSDRHPLGRHPSPRQTPPPPPPVTATAADGTHPTGMHSCFHAVFGNIGKFWIRH